MRGVQVIQGSRGPVVVPEDAFIEAPWGIPGFRDEKSWVLIRPYSGYPIMVLQSATTPYVSLPVTIPWIYHQDYEMKVLDSTLIELGVYSRAEVEVLAVVSGTINPTINLYAPIVINRSSMVAMQAINQIDGYSTRDPLVPIGAMEPISMDGWEFPSALSAT